MGWLVEAGVFRKPLIAWRDGYGTWDMQGAEMAMVLRISAEQTGSRNLK